MTTATIGAHAFAPSGRREPGPGGARTYEVCAVCGRRQIGTVHGRRDGGLTMPAPAPRKTAEIPRRLRRAVPTPTPPTITPAPTPSPPTLATRMLALAVGLALADHDGLGWRIRWRLADIAHEIRNAYPELVDYQLPSSVSETPPPRPVLLPSKVERETPPGVAMTPKGVRRAVARARDTGVRAVALAALGAGYTARRTGGGHVVMRSPDGEHTLSIVLTNTDPRAWLNLRAEARRQGLDV